jgi:hypothetical protein
MALRRVVEHGPARTSYEVAGGGAA